MLKLSAMKNIGMIRVKPSDYVIRLKNGKISKQGLGMNFFKMPSEQFVIIPSIVSNIPFIADQITKENQGVEVSGFAIWKVSDPTKIYLHFDFSEGEKPINTVNVFLKDVVESAIRHQVANMTIEEVLRKRGSIILKLKNELEYISNQWGISIETIEIKNVKIMSSQLFHNMQATFRNQVKLESETSALKTDQEISEQQITHRTRIAELEQSASKKDSERKLELETLELKNTSQLSRLQLEEKEQQKMLEKNSDQRLQEEEENSKQIIIAKQTDTIKIKATLQDEEMKAQLKANELKVKFEQEIIFLEKERIKAQNSQNDMHVLYQKLPQIMESLNINELNIGQADLQKAIAQISSLFTNNDS